MKHLSKFIISGFLLLGCAQLVSAAMIDNCADLASFKPAPYIDLASALQALPKQEAIRRLKMWASTHDHDVQIIILCQMLFEPKPGKKLDRPLLGAPQFYGDSTIADWPQEPITIIDDIPFTIAISYMIAGAPVNGSAYLNYCVSNAEWTTRRYQAVDQKQIDAAVQQLLKSTAWKRPLNAWELGLLKKQAE